MMKILLVATLLMSSCHWGKNDQNQQQASPPTPPPPPPTQAQVFDTGDQVQALLRDRVSKVFNTGDDFRVLVTQVDYPIGTLMQEGRTVALTDSACMPPPIHAYALPNMFNAIEMRGKAAFDLGIDSAAVAGLAKFGVKAGQEDVFDLSVNDAQGKFLLDQALRDLQNQPSCAAALKGQTLLLVRGYVVGKRNYTLQRSGNVGAQIGVAKIGDLNVQAEGMNGISLADAAPVEFLQIVSKVSLPGTPPPPPPPPPAPGIHPGPPAHFPGHIPPIALNNFHNIQPPPAPTPVGAAGRVYLQRDVADTGGNADKLKGLLTGQQFAVVPQVEAIASNKMPTIAQVRYFNTNDSAAADRAVAVLRQVYPSASKLYVGLKAPPGQLEVWLPKVGG